MRLLTGGCILAGLQFISAFLMSAEIGHASSASALVRQAMAHRHLAVLRMDCRLPYVLLGYFFAERMDR